MIGSARRAAGGPLRTAFVYGGYGGSAEPKRRRRGLEGDATQQPLVGIASRATAQCVRPRPRASAARRLLGIFELVQRRDGGSGESPAPKRFERRRQRRALPSRDGDRAAPGGSGSARGPQPQAMARARPPRARRARSSGGSAARAVAAEQIGGSGGLAKTGPRLRPGADSILLDAASGSTSGALRSTSAPSAGTAVDSSSSDPPAEAGGAAHSELDATNPGGGDLSILAEAVGGLGGGGAEASARATTQGYHVEAAARATGGAGNDALGGLGGVPGGDGGAGSVDAVRASGALAADLTARRVRRGRTRRQCGQREWRQRRERLADRRGRRARPGRRDLASRAARRGRKRRWRLVLGRRGRGRERRQSARLGIARFRRDADRAPPAGPAATPTSRADAAAMPTPKRTHARPRTSARWPCRRTRSQVPGASGSPGGDGGAATLRASGESFGTDAPAFATSIDLPGDHAQDGARGGDGAARGLYGAGAARNGGDADSASRGIAHGGGEVLVYDRARGGAAGQLYLPARSSARGGDARSSAYGESSVTGHNVSVYSQAFGGDGNPAAGAGDASASARAIGGTAFTFAVAEAFAGRQYAGQPAANCRGAGRSFGRERGRPGDRADRNSRSRVARHAECRALRWSLSRIRGRTRVRVDGGRRARARCGARPVVRDRRRPAARDRRRRCVHARLERAQ